MLREETRSRSEILLAEVTRQIAERRAHLDAATDLGEISIIVKMNAGTTRVRGVIWHEERVCLPR